MMRRLLEVSHGSDGRVRSDECRRWKTQKTSSETCDIFLRKLGMLTRVTYTIGKSILKMTEETHNPKHFKNFSRI